ncbi:DUF58 domain-containing protein [Duganella sp. sic0402]|uniref:DUF58 domain-containing protein n=1 Tax=Duganella sp. sic0402 TaxID=2854786 RepID=UPI001C46A5F0|nr:DUF58 domain-containing protein [Duganella sp. sic0402]MBV7536033.1 DUF58 domain-containing protein [Duganella sp. sic0402]
MRGALQAWYRKGRDQWLFQLRAREPGVVTLGMRRVFIVPARAGLAFVVLLLVMLIGALNYNLGLGWALTFFAAACAVADMLLTARNLAGLQLAPGRAPPVFAGEAAQFELLVRNPGRRERFALWIGFQADGQPRQAVDVAAGGASAVLLSAPAPQRGWLAAPRVRLVTRFPLGLFRAWSYWQPDAQVLVYPAPELPAQPLPSSGAASEDGHGAVGLDNFAGIRAYQAGDPLRHLAWRQIARHDPALGGQLVSKHFEGGAVAELALDFAALPPQLPLEQKLSRMARWVLMAEQGAVPYRFRLAQHDYGPALGDAHQAACLRALALFGQEDAA